MIKKLTDQKFILIFYLVPFVALLLCDLNFIIGYAFVIDIFKFSLFLFLNVLFFASCSLVCGNILIELALEFFSKSEKSENLDKLYKNPLIPIKPLIFVAVFTALYIYLSIDLTNLNFIKMIIMLIPSAALIINSKYFLSGKVRFINSKYLRFDGKFTEMFSFNLNPQDEIVFVTSDAAEIPTGVRETDIDFDKFKSECEKNGLKSMMKK